MTPLFGTDGVRGVANRDLTPEVAFSVGRALVEAIAPHGRPRVAIGRDTRVSGPMLQAALSAGICSAGADVIRLGVVPTPAVAHLTAELGMSAGAVISASHNPPEYNGIKLFSSDGFKLPDELEARIEELVSSDRGARPEGDAVGSVADRPDAAERYLEHVVSTTSSKLEGMAVVVDCANGAAYRLGPEALRRLGADLRPLNADGDGRVINVESGAASPGSLAAVVRNSGADAGVAFDGDADRALFSDAEGNVIDGDRVIAACAVELRERGRLPGDTVVVTVMTNLGVRRSMEERGIKVVETRVGDRYVLEEMRRLGAGLGGEQSGHLIFLEHSTTGDGILTAVQFLSLAASRGASLAELTSEFRPYPQVLESVSVQDPVGVAAGAGIEAAVRRAEAQLGEGGRVLVRPSGTEPVVRVMVEAEAEEAARKHAADLVEAVKAAV